MPDVVTCVLLHDGKILLLKRSDKVGTYRGKWACVSGYVEEGDKIEDRAFREIEEETGLSRDNLKLEKTGQPDGFFDEAEKKSWRVHPFLFTSDTGDVKIDWEHIEYRWIEPSEIGNYDTVPKLKEVVKSLISR